MQWTSLAKYPIAARLALFVLTLLLLWIPFAVPIYRFVGDPNWQSILSMSALYAEFIVLARFWGRRVYGISRVLHRYGLQFSPRFGRDWGSGLLAGLVSLSLLLLLEGTLGWLAWNPPPGNLIQTVVEGLLVASAVGFAEELLFRGWLLDELERDYRANTALWANATIFAMLHFIKPWEAIVENLPAFPGLVLLGATLVWAKRSSGGLLGLPMGFHGGLVWGYYIVNTGQLLNYSGRVPGWVTGLGNNPLAGVMGMLFLGAIALWMRRRALVQR
ncbi:MAG: CPBP family intramembrane metalloprotease [Cyanobacteria bacterium J007]|nr:MAG: CPBP family intramembrane metalloprotease [Cyanobacteria bacterium J007]